MSEGWFSGLKNGLSRTTSRVTSGIAQAVAGRRLDKKALQALEETLITADLGVTTATKLISSLEAEKFDAISILDNGKAINISQLTSLVKQSSFIVANDTGPAHIAAHVGAKGITLFGKHTTAIKVSIEREKFKSIQRGCVL